MAKFNIDLTKFKKVSMDKNKTTLEHEDGHQLTINHKTLSKPMKSELMALDFSGPDEDDQHEKRYADGGNVQKPQMDPADAGVNRAANDHSDPSKLSGIASGFNNATSGSQPKPVKQYAEGSEQPIASTDSAPSIPVATDPNQVSMPDAILNSVSSIMPQAQSPQQSPQGQPTAQPQAALAQSAGQNPDAPNPQDGATPPDQNSMKQDLEGSFGEESNAMQAGAAAEGKLGRQNASVEQNTVHTMADTQKTLQTNQGKVMDEANKVIQEINNPSSNIDANHLVDNMSTTKKISTAIGLILGGIGGGITGQENPALKFLNAQIDRDVQAQTTNLNKKQNLVGAYFKEYGNLQDATQQAQITLLTQAAHQMQANADKMSDPIAKARATAAVAEIFRNQIQPKTMEMSMRQTMMQMASKPGANNDAALAYLDQVNPTYSKELRSRLVGNELAERPVDDKTRQNLVEKQSLVNNIQDLRQFANQHSGSLDPAIIAQGKAKANITLNQLRTATDQGVIKPSEIEFDRQLIDADPTKFFSKMRTDPKYAEVERWGTNDLNATRNSLGLKPYAGTNGQQGHQALPQQSQAPTVKTMGGKPYQKIGNNWYPVK